VRTRQHPPSPDLKATRARLFFYRCPRTLIDSTATMFNLHGPLMKWFGLAMLFLASAGFVLLGMGDLQFGNRDQAVAQVDGQDITQTEWDNAHSQAIDRALSANPQLDLNLLDSPFMRYQSLQDLVHDHVLGAVARKEHLVASDSHLI